jgi:hypothetical protein
MKTAYILVRHLDSEHGVDVLDIGGGRLVRIPQNAAGRQLIEKCHTLFPAAYALFSDWLYERRYPETPASRVEHDPSGQGDIPYESEDLLLALRLVQPGDITFVAQALVEDDGPPLFQQRYRYFGEIASTHPYRLEPHQIPTVEHYLRLVRTPSADSAWFSVAKRFFLYGGAKEFNPYIGELDRILDFAVALEAVLLFENEFVGRLLRNRALALLGIEGDAVKPVKRLLGDFYGHRSKLAHGEPLEIEDQADFHAQMEAFERLVRAVLRVALEMIPADDDARRQRLTALATVTDEDRVAFLIERAKSLEDVDRRQRVVAALQG